MSLLKRTGTAIDDVTWDATELATKASVDAVKKTADSAKTTAESAKGVADAALSKAGGTMTGAINMNDKQVKNVGAPTDVNDAVTKKYVDDALSGVQPVGDYVSKSGDTMTGNLNMGNHQISNVDTMTVSNVIVKGSADSQVSIKTTGDASRSEIDLNDASDNPVVIKGVDTPADDMDAANKSYVDAVDAKVTAANAEITGVKNTVNGITNGNVKLPYLSKNGGAMSGNAVITGVTVPDNVTADTVASVGYVNQECNKADIITLTPAPDVTIDESLCVMHHRIILCNIIFRRSPILYVGFNKNYPLFKINLPNNLKIFPMKFSMFGSGVGINAQGQDLAGVFMYECVCEIDAEGNVRIIEVEAATDVSKTIIGEPANATYTLSQMFAIVQE